MEELIEKAQNGDVQAFTNLILLIEKDLYSIAKSKIDNENDIEDVIQETMLAAFVSIKKLKDKRFFKTWIIRILLNNCHKTYRRKKHTVFIENQTFDFEQLSQIDVSDMEFEEFIRFLNDEEKTILTMYYKLGYTTKEISKILHKQEGTICSKISRAKKKIKEKYKGEFY